MPVWAAGETVRGYKAEQFADAFAQLALAGVSGVSRQSPPQAGTNAPNAPNAKPRQQRQNGRPLIGDELYPLMLADAVRDGHLTDAEAEQQYAHHNAVVAASSDPRRDRNDEVGE
jgi:hypothetical protein